MTEAPAPMTPAGSDLRDLPSMLLDVVRLRDSEAAAVVDAEGFRAAVLLWCAAWHQVPAASLPDDDSALCRFAGYGRDMKTWKRAKAAGAMRGWVKCHDGRLYHPVVAEKALEAIDYKAKQRARTDAARQAVLDRKKGKNSASENDATESVTDRESASVTDTATESVTDPVTHHVTHSVTDSKERKGKEREEKKERKVPPSAGADAPLADPRSVVWSEGLAELQRITGLPAGKAKPRLGQLLRDANDDCPGLMRVLRDCPATGDPQAWLSRAAQALARPREPPSKLGWMLGDPQPDGPTIDAEPEPRSLLQ